MKLGPLQVNESALPLILLALVFVLSLLGAFLLAGVR